ncbi:hypothetical protein niasHS_003193 [Heterodera schachtii]|uniref:Bestrophin homolog n=2 Tax=Heterodera TaxID=34509 RepID=A0ABD2KH46_HETSC
MTISYTLDVSKSSWGGFFRILSRWRGSVWKAVMGQLIIWTIIYMLISLVYRRLLNTRSQETFEHLVHYLNYGLDSTIPLTFMLGFFVTQVVSRWQSVLNGLGWIDNSAMNFANYIRGTDTETRITRRTLIRYMVLCQALVLRDISVQVRKRFPTLDTLVAAGLISKPELEQLDREVHDKYSRYWTPIHWCNSILYEARLHGKIASDFLLESIINDIQHFRHGLASLMKYDWVPIPLLYPQIVFLAVRLYFLICLISRQFIYRKEAKHHAEIDLFVPIGTMIQFIVYVGWMKVAEALLNPLGEDDDDLECNYVIDKNLITGFSLVDLATKRTPEQSRDVFWDNDHIAPLYSMEAAQRTVHPLIGSASKINMAKGKKTITMAPHKSKLSKMDERTRLAHIRLVDTMEHNVKHAEELKEDKANNENKALGELRKRQKSGKIRDGRHMEGMPSTRSAPDLERDGFHRLRESKDGEHSPSHHRLNGTSPHRTRRGSPFGAGAVRQPDPLSQGHYIGEEIPQRDLNPYMGHIQRGTDDMNGSRGNGTGGLRRF